MQAAGLAAAAFVGYVLNRTVGLPHASEDIRNWTAPIGMAALFVEGGVLAVSAFSLGVAKSIGAETVRHDPVPA